MSKPAHNDVLKWGYENYLIDNRDFRRGFIEVNLADFAEVVYAAGFEAGKKDEREACAEVCDNFEHLNWDYMTGAGMCANLIRKRVRNENIS